ncbi:hypothetical protein [Sediminibacterium ginsengisoli]|uniref:Uncharacterized protein n=1 Tax=Sediminibacterium ginsengisoli TaxID=413434 RepID=A0A1T4QZH5_9BACT|nr:hypothetical protein [Sediminibacterium ginsengisoli]SKA09242.1 hypothetical protein SAMN04488132_11022 [Sediminibacterium ginsengisoli]
MRIFFLIVSLVCLFSCQRKYEKEKWATKEDFGPPAARKAMLKDLLANYNLKGKTTAEILNLLGSPDFKTDTVIAYKVVEDYGSDIDPVYTKTLVLKLGGSIVTQARVDEWKK